MCLSNDTRTSSESIALSHWQSVQSLHCCCGEKHKSLENTSPRKCTKCSLNMSLSQTTDGHHRESIIALSHHCWPDPPSHFSAVHLIPGGFTSFQTKLTKIPDRKFVFWWLFSPFLRLFFLFLRLITILIFLIRSPLVFSLSPGLEVTPMTLRCQSKIIMKLLFFGDYFQLLSHKTVKQWHISRGNWDGVKYIFASGDIAWGGVEIVHQKAPRWKWVFSEYGTDSLESIIYQMYKC